jgi:hypothetical protein
VDSGGGVAGVSCIDPSAHKERGPQDDSVREDSVMEDGVMEDSAGEDNLGRGCGIGLMPGLVLAARTQNGNAVANILGG